PHARKQLRQAAVGNREPQDDPDPPRTDQVPVDEAEQHRRGGEAGKAERPWVGGRPTGEPPAGRFDGRGRRYIGLAGSGSGSSARPAPRSGFVTTGFHLTSSVLRT